MKVSLRQPLNVINDELVDYGNIEYEDIETEVDPPQRIRDVEDDGGH
jgi:hypothetical protein